MEHFAVGAAITFALGVLVSYINYRLTLTLMRKRSDAAIVPSSLRQLVNVLYFVAVYFAAPYTPWERIPLLVGAAAGATLSLFLFTFLLVRKMKDEEGK